MSRRANDAVAEAIKREWGNIPVVEAKHDLRVFIKPEDVKGATRKDPGRCVFANACRRTFGSDKVLFFRRTAYVELRAEDGSRRVERFTLGEGMRDLIELFDTGQPVIPEAGFLLKAPCKSRRLDEMRQYQKERQKNRTKSLILGTSTPEKKTHEKNGGAKGLTKDFQVRSGTGAVHFIKENPE